MSTSRIMSQTIARKQTFDHKVLPEQPEINPIRFHNFCLAAQLVYGCAIKAHLDHAGSVTDGLSLKPDLTAYRSETCPVLNYASMLTRQTNMNMYPDLFIIHTNPTIWNRKFSVGHNASLTKSEWIFEFIKNLERFYREFGSKIFHEEHSRSLRIFNNIRCIRRQEMSFKKLKSSFNVKNKQTKKKLTLNRYSNLLTIKNTTTPWNKKHGMGKIPKLTFQILHTWNIYVYEIVSTTLGLIPS